MARNWYDSVVPEDAAPAPREIDVSVVHPARVHDYWLGGKDNVAVDRVAAERVLDAKPRIPAESNPHEVAQAVRPAARVTCVDNDPIVLAHAPALPASRPRPGHVHRRRPVGRRHDLVPGGRDAELRRPVAVMLIAVLHLIPDEGRTRAGADAPVAAGSQRSRGLVLRLRGRRAETLPG